jgi:phosphoenolpyruvate synthase/pyruvate phosphate dikinase
MNIIWLGEPKSYDVTLVGGKMANLGRLTQVYAPIPDGFGLPASVLQQLHPRHLRKEIGQAIDKMIACHELSELIVAVRSSAISEDSAAASFAGQHDTFLNVSGLEAIIEAISACWASGRSAHALDYRRRQVAGNGNPEMAVFIQQFIPADVSAVAFSTHPTSGNQNEIVINTSWGLGESIVGGTVTPDTFTVNKNEMSVIQQLIADKRRMTVAISGGTREVDVPSLLRQEAVLSMEQVLEIARLAILLEEKMGVPVDLECAFAGGQLYLLQCRPISA